MIVIDDVMMMSSYTKYEIVMYEMHTFWYDIILMSLLCNGRWHDHLTWDLTWYAL